MFQNGCKTIIQIDIKKRQKSSVYLQVIKYLFSIESQQKTASKGAALRH